MGDQPAGLHCPECRQLAVFTIGGNDQAWCGNDDCRVLTWDPTMSVADNLADVHEVNLGGGAG